MSKLPTAEETLNQHLSGVYNPFGHPNLESSFIAAIESHTAAHTAGLREEIVLYKKAILSEQGIQRSLKEKNKALRKRLGDLEEGLKPIANTHDAAIEIDPIGIAYKMRNAAERALKKALK